MNTAKDEALRLIHSLPDRATWNDILYALTVIMKIEEGLKDVEAGRTIPHEVVKKQFSGKITP